MHGRDHGPGRRRRRGAIVALCALVASPLGCVKACERRVEARAPSTTERPPPAPAAPRDPLRDALAEADRLAEGGELAEALAALEALLEGNDDEPRVRARLAVLHNRLAVEHAAARRYRDGERASARALAFAPDDPVVRRNRVNILYALAKELPSPDARRRLYEEILELDEEHLATLVAAAEDAYDDNRLEEAKALYLRAQRVSPGDDALARRLARVSQQAEVEGAFQGARDNHFVARFEGYAQERLAYKALGVLEGAYFAVNEKLSLYPSEDISVVIYTGDQYRRATGMPDWSGGAFDGKIRVREGDLAEESGQLTNLLWHEYVHALLHGAVRGRLPSWFQEGLAQYFEPSRSGRHHERIAAALELLPLRELEAPFVRIQDPTAVTLAYAQSLSLVEHLASKQGAYGLSRLLDEVNEGKPFEEALKDVYFLDARGLEEDWRQALGR